MGNLDWKRLAIKAAADPRVRRAVLSVLAAIFLLVMMPIMSLPSMIFEASDAATVSTEQTMQTGGREEKTTLLSRIFGSKNDPGSLWSLFSGIFGKKDYDDTPLLMGAEEMNIFDSEEALKATLQSKVDKTKSRIVKKIRAIESEIDADAAVKMANIQAGSFPAGFPSAYRGYDEYVCDYQINGYTSALVDDYDAVKLVALYTVMKGAEERSEKIGDYLDWLGNPLTWSGTFLKQEDQLSYYADKKAGTLKESNYKKTALLNSYVKYDPANISYTCERLKSKTRTVKYTDPETGEEKERKETTTRCKVTINYTIETMGYYEFVENFGLWTGPLTEENAEELGMPLSWTSPGGQEVFRNFPSQLEYYETLMQTTGSFLGYDGIFFADGDNYVGNIALQMGRNSDYAWPFDTSAGQVYKVTSRVGHRGWATAGSPEFHAGTDIGAAVGTKVYSATDGEVVYVVRQDKSARGVYIGIKDKGGLVNIYQHLLEGSIPSMYHVGAIVEQGDYIGMVGKTGFITGPHLHWEIRQGNMTGTIVDAMNFFEYSRVGN